MQNDGAIRRAGGPRCVVSSVGPISRRCCKLKETFEICLTPLTRTIQAISSEEMGRNDGSMVGFAVLVNGLVMEQQRMGTPSVGMKTTISRSLVGLVFCEECGCPGVER